MSLRIGSNLAALSASRSVARAQRDMDRSLKALATGKRIVNSGDDAAGFAIGETLRGQELGIRQSKLNAEQAVSSIQVAEGGLNEQNNIVIRLRELAVQAASDTVDEAEREFIDLEFQQLVQEFDRIAETTRFGSTKLLAGQAKEFEFQLGANSDSSNIVKFNIDVDTRASNIGLDGLGVLDKSDARSSLDVLDEAVVEMAGVRAQFGAIQSRLMTANEHLAVQEENITAARSRITDADVAEETARLASAQIRQNFAISVLSQANQSNKEAIMLIA